MMGACVDGKRCVGFDRIEGTAADAGPGPLCVGCLARAAADVRSLPGDHAGLAVELVPAQGGLSTRVSGGGGQGAPLALAVEALQREIVYALTVWEPAVREASGLPDAVTRGVRDSWAVATAAGVLAPRIGVLAALGPVWGFADGPEAGPVLRDGLAGITRLRRLHRHARGVLGQIRPVYDLPGECSSCGASALRRTDGSDTVRCDLCRRSWSYEAYRRYVGLILEDVAS